jgi:hypothetical protein
LGKRLSPDCIRKREKGEGKGMEEKGAKEVGESRKKMEEESCIQRKYQQSQ